MTFDVGQIVYFLSKTTMMVLPLKIEEQIIKKTSSGQEVSYVVKASNDGKRLVVKDTSDIYTTTADVRDCMIRNACQAIDDMIKKAETAAEIFSSINENELSDNIVDSDNSDDI